MKFITSSTEFFELHNNPKLIKLRESILAVPIDNWKYIMVDLYDLKSSKLSGSAL